MTENQMQEKLGQFQMLQQHIEHISEQVEKMNGQLAELEISMHAIEKVSTLEKGNAFLAPVANGIFLKGKVQDTSTMIVNVGNNVTVERTPAEVLVLLKKQEKEITAKLAEADEILKLFSEQAMKIYQELENVQETEE
jgi:prefoldin alpha subunit